MKKKLLILSTLIMVIFFLSSGAFASQSNISVDGINKSLVLEIADGRTYINEKSLKGIGLDYVVNQNKVIVSNREVKLEFILNSGNVKVNDVNFSLDAKSYKKNGEIYLPLRFLLETIGYEVMWDPKEQNISVNKGVMLSYPVTIIDGDQKYTVNEEPQTIVSLAPSVTETLFDIGAGEKLLGKTKYCNYPKEANDIKIVGSMTDPDLELVMSINPDMVLAATHYKQEVLGKLNQGGIEVVAKASPNTLEELYDYTLKLGAIVNRNYEARALVSTMRSKVDRVKYVIKDVNKRPTAYYVVGTGQYGEYTAGRGTFISEAINISGGKNVADDVTGWTYSLEKLISKDPEYIFGSQDTYDIMTTSDNYRILSAITNGKFIIIDDDIFSRPTNRFIDEGLKILVKMFHGSKSNKLNY